MEAAAQKKWTKPEPVIEQDAGPEIPAFRYLASRGISLDTISAYRVGHTNRGQLIVFPYLHTGGGRDDLVFQKSRPAISGEDCVPTGSGYRPTLFGWQAVPENARTMIVVEGEIDAMSGLEYGLPYPVLSVPFGGGSGQKQQWVESDWDMLRQFDRIILALDNDTEGDLGADEIAKRVGRYRCYRARLPKKDLNECLTSGVSPDTIKGLIESAASLMPDDIRTPPDYRERLHKLLAGEEEAGAYCELPWDLVPGGFRIRPGELTLWTGETGAGKSQALSHAACHWIASGENVFSISAEMTPEQQLRRMIRQATALDDITPHFLDAAIDWLGGKAEHIGQLLIYDRQGRIETGELFDTMTYARRRYGCGQIIVDSLMRLGIGVEDWEGQADMTLKLAQWCIEEDAHIHLVAHNRKSEMSGSGRMQGTTGVKGAMEIGANASNHIEIVRKKHIEAIRQRLDRGEMVSDKERETANSYAVLVALHKHRNGDGEGTIGLEFHQASYQYIDYLGAAPRRFVPWAGDGRPVVTANDMEDF